MKKRLRPVVILLMVLYTKVHAASIVWPSVIFGREGEIYGIGSTLVEDTSGYAGVAMEILALSATPTLSVYRDGVTLAVGHFWYETTLSVPINAITVGSATPFAENLGQGGWQPIDLYVNQVFYLGFWLDVDGSGTPSSASDIYGWAGLLWDGTELALVDSAAETTGVGLYAGTYNPIPEPAAVGLLLVGLAALATRRPRKRWTNG